MFVNQKTKPIKIHEQKVSGIILIQDQPNITHVWDGNQSTWQDKWSLFIFYRTAVLKSLGVIFKYIFISNFFQSKAKSQSVTKIADIMSVNSVCQFSWDTQKCITTKMAKPNMSDQIILLSVMFFALFMANGNEFIWRTHGFGLSLWLQLYFYDHFFNL